MYTLGRWLLPGRSPGEIATMQPVPMRTNDFWTDDFEIAAGWFRSEDNGKQMRNEPQAPAKAKAIKPARRGKSSGLSGA